MGIGVRQGAVNHCADLDAISAFVGKEKVIKVQMWSFERLTMASVSLQTKQSRASIVLPVSVSRAAEMVSSYGWPSPLIHGRSLPNSAGLLYVDTFPKVEEPVAEPQPTTAGVSHAPRPLRIRRVRAA